MQRDFLWGGRALTHKPYLVNWFVCCMEKQKRGLDIRNLSILNKALLGKWSCRFVSERNPLWIWVIVGKYEQERGGWCTKEVREGYDVGVWKTIKGG